jgi:hypothetical protein
MSDETPWDNLVATFTTSGLPLPPIPRPLRSELRLTADWCWSTRDISPMSMYMFDSSFIQDILADRVDDYAAICHAGHGVNSYGINFHLVYRQLAIVMQCGWGGVYMDNDGAAARLAERWRKIEVLLEQSAAADDRLVVVYSDFRGISARGRVTRPAVGGPNFERAYAIDGDPFAGGD